MGAEVGAHDGGELFAGDGVNDLGFDSGAALACAGHAAGGVDFHPPGGVFDVSEGHLEAGDADAEGAPVATAGDNEEVDGGGVQDDVP